MTTGFLEESPGVKSSTRLMLMWCMLLATFLVLTACWFVVYTPREHTAEVLGGLGTILVTITVKAIVAIRNRNGGDDPKDGAT